MSADVNDEAIIAAINLIMENSAPIDTLVMHPWDWLEHRYGLPAQQLHARLLRRLRYPGGRKARRAAIRLTFGKVRRDAVYRRWEAGDE